MLLEEKNLNRFQFKFSQLFEKLSQQAQNSLELDFENEIAM